MAWFSVVPVVDVHRDNFQDMWPTMMLAIKSSSFVAVDTELSGLGPRRALMAQSVEDRYKAIYDIAKTRAMVSIGLSCFKIPYSVTVTETQSLPFFVQTFNIIMLCQEDYMVEPGAVQFLVEHGFDFNKQYSKGVPFYRGSDKKEEKQDIRDLFSAMIQYNKPLVLHNGLVDLVFLYQSFYTELPTTLSTFLADMSEMFTGGIYDTKYIAEFHARFSASYLEYVFRRSQRENAVSESKGERHISVEFPHYPSNMDCVEFRHCGLPSDLTNTMITGCQLQQKIDICEQYANYGYCKLSISCPKSHDPDIILDREDVSVVKKRKRKRRKRNRSGRDNTKQQRLSSIPEEGVAMDTKDAVEDVSDEDDEDDDEDVLEKHPPSLAGNGNLDRILDGANLPDPHKTGMHATSTVGSTEPDTTLKSGVLPQQRMKGHRAGFDAFMTGFAMATFVSKLGKSKPPEQESHNTSIAEKYELGVLANRLCLSGKDIPLQIMKSNFSKTSSLHRMKIEKLRSEVEV
ncbi:target of EGR1 protein 1-like [Glandiceps talaboti]